MPTLSEAAIGVPGAPLLPPNPPSWGGLPVLLLRLWVAAEMAGSTQGLESSTVGNNRGGSKLMSIKVEGKLCGATSTTGGRKVTGVTRRKGA